MKKVTLPDWNLVDELGGPDAFDRMMTVFYDRLYDDVLIGFFFQPHDKRHLIESQMRYLSAHLGDRAGDYEGPKIRRAHQNLPILPGHFDRRHKILVDLLEEFAVPLHVRKAWLDLDLVLRDFVINLGATRRDTLLAPDGD